MEQEAIRIAGKNRPRTNRERLTGSERAVKAGISRSDRIMQTDHGGTPLRAQSRKIAVRQTEERTGSRRHDRKRFLGAAPRGQRQQKYSFDGKIAGSQRPHG